MIDPLSGLLDSKISVLWVHWTGPAPVRAELCWPNLDLLLKPREHELVVRTIVCQMRDSVFLVLGYLGDASQSEGCSLDRGLRDVLSRL